MKSTSAVALLFAVQMASVPLLARGIIKEADYPVEYEVVNTSKTAKLVIEKQCSMTLRNRARTNGFGSCHVLENGKVYRGRQNQKQNQIELVILVGQDKARIENWQIVGTVNNTPSPTPPSGSE